MNAFICKFIAILTAGVCAAMWRGQAIESWTYLDALSASVSLYLLTKMHEERQRNPKAWMASSIVLCSVVTFLFGFTATNWVYYESGPTLVSRFQLLEFPSNTMIRHLEMAFMAVLFMWLGHGSRLALASKRLSAYRGLRLILESPVPKDLLPRLVLLGAVGILFDAIRLERGLLGYAGSFDSYIDNADISFYVSAGSKLSYVSLFCLQYSTGINRSNYGARISLWVIFFIKSAVGLYAGMKSEAIAPSAVLVIATLLRSSRPNMQIIAAAVTMAVAAFVIVPQIRSGKTSLAGSDAVNAAELAEIVGTVDYSSGDSKSNILQTAASRLNILFIGSLGIEYCDRAPSFGDGRPAFLGDLLRAPLYAWVPRLIWPDKPIFTNGLWYTNQVVGVPVQSSTAMGPITYLYFCGREIAIIIGFFLFGLVLRTINEWLRPELTLRGAIVWLTVLPQFVWIESDSHQLLISFLRMVPIGLALQAALFYSPKNISW